MIEVALVPLHRPKETAEEEAMRLQFEKEWEEEQQRMMSGEHSS